MGLGMADGSVGVDEGDDGGFAFFEVDGGGGGGSALGEFEAFEEGSPFWGEGFGVFLPD